MNPGGEGKSNHQTEEETMAHHGPMSEEMRKILDEQVREFGLGATGRFPDGKIVREDQGEIKISIGVANRISGAPHSIVMHFGKEVAWIGFTAAQAREIAKTLVANADALEGMIVKGEVEDAG